LLIKERDNCVRTGEAAHPPDDSVLSGRTVEQIAAAEDIAADLAKQCAKAGAKKANVPFKDVRPMLATPGKPFSHRDWVFEIKYDGYRLLAGKERGEVRLLSRNTHDFTSVFPEIAEVLAALPYEHFLLDGEIVVHDSEGLPSFAGLQQRGRLTRELDIGRAAVQWPATFYAFDLLLFGDYDLRNLPLLERKRLLVELLPSVGPIRVSEHIAAEGEAMFEKLGSMGLEGIVAKRATSTYVGKRSADWIKVSARSTDDFAVVGYTPPDRGRTGFGALLLAQRGTDGWTYAGRVGGGFDDATLKTLGERLAVAPKGAEPHSATAETGDARWIAPALVVEVQFKERTAEGRLRHPVFQRIRVDKNPEDCWLPGEAKPLLELPTATAKSAPVVRITNPDKVFWPNEGYTKGDLIAYYRAVAPYLLPYLRDRPLVLTRYPDGIDGKSFYQKDAPDYAPDWIRLEALWSEGSEREIRYFVIDSEEGLAYIANMAAIPLHIWSSRTTSLQHPDWCILDLDPKGAPFAHVVEVARAIHKLCASIELPHFVKTSGSTGLHVLIPLGALCTHEQSRSLAELLANCVVKELPEISTVARQLDAREGKVYVDYLQNGHGRLLVAPYSVRPVPGATVSMPLNWSQVTARLDMHKYDLRTAPPLLAKQKTDPFAGLFTEVADLPHSLARLADLQESRG
jgi:bifunctional non-homologous end joining protein LigD